MRMDTMYLLKEIENLRNQLYVLSKDRELADPAVVQMSQKLDSLLNLYHRSCSIRSHRRVVS